jgi:transposase
MLKEAKRHPAFKQLQMVPGLGPVRVAEIISAVGSPHRFRTERQFRTYCGWRSLLAQVRTMR